MKTKIFLSFVFAALCGLGLFAPTALASSNTPPDLCYDIKGSGEIVGLGNSGSLEFDGPPPDFPYQACIEDDPNVIGGTMHEFRGWVWNTNLGWASTYCSGGLNNGLSCGGTEYKSYIDTSTGDLSGFWWGDGIGWIALNCSSLGTCDTVNFKVSVDIDPASADLGKIDPNHRYAWSDNVGWIDLAGTGLPGPDPGPVYIPWIKKMVKVKVADPIPPIAPFTWDPQDAIDGTDPTVNASRVYAFIYPDASAFTPAHLADPLKTPKPVVADGEQSYGIYVHFADIDGNKLVIANDPPLNIGLTVEDTVKTNQINNDGENAVNWTYKTSGFPLNSTNPKLHESFVTSKAPTSNYNATDNDNNGTFDCYFAVDAETPLEICDGAAAGKYYARVTNDRLPVVFFDTTFPENIVKFNLSLPIYGTKDLKFAPPIDVNFLSTIQDSNQPYFSALRNQLLKVFYKAVNRSDMISAENVDLKLNLSSNDNKMKLVAMSATDDQGVREETPHITNTWFQVLPPDIDNNTLKNFFVIPMLSGQAGGGEIEDAGTEINDPRIKATVRYTLNDGTLIQYFSNGLPRVESKVFNPSAEIRGPVDVQGALKVTTGMDVRSSSDISTDRVRTAILRNVSRLMAGAKNLPTIRNSFTLHGAGFDGTSNKGVLLGPHDKTNKKHVVYFYGDLTIDSPTPTPTPWWTTDQTIIVMGGNVFIDSNLIANGSKHLGLIVLEDKTQTTYDKRGGNIYVHPDVTDLVGVNIYADGVFTRYNPSKTPAFNANTGEPVYDDFSGGDCVGILKNQLFIEGSLATKNTIGGSDREPVIIGGGKTLDANKDKISTIGERERAKLYDLNYLSCFQRNQNRDAEGNFIEGVFTLSGAVSSVLATRDPGNYNPTVIYYSPPSKNLPAFSATDGSLFDILR